MAGAPGNKKRLPGRWPSGLPAIAGMASSVPTVQCWASSILGEAQEAGDRKQETEKRGRPGYDHEQRSLPAEPPGNQLLDSLLRGNEEFYLVTRRSGVTS
jgi:hypothetical protein